MTRRSLVISFAAQSLSYRFQTKLEDFPQAGLVLIGPSSSDYNSLVSQIKARSSPTPPQSDFETPEDPNRSVVFINKSEKPVALLQVLWHFAFADGREAVGACAWAGSELLLLPFDVTPQNKSAMKYSSAILPGSKRYITNAGNVIGDNTDVRPPSDDEIAKGGGISGSGGGYLDPKPFTRLTISIEGAFFDSGEFAGTNRTKLFEQIVAEANARAKIIEMARQKGKSASAILDEIQSSARELKTRPRPLLIPDPNMPISVYEQRAFFDLATNIENTRAFKGDSQTLGLILNWASSELPAFRKL
jgi:hypothetical protein